MSQFLLQAVRPPIISNCLAYRSIAERSSPGSAVSPTMAANVSSIDTVITWAFVNPNPGLPFAIGPCDGKITVISDVTWSAASSYMVTVAATNDGTLIGLGSTVSSCLVTIDILQVKY